MLTLHKAVSNSRPPDIPLEEVCARQNTVGDGDGKNDNDDDGGGGDSDEDDNENTGGGGDGEIMVTMMKMAFPHLDLGACRLPVADIFQTRKRREVEKEQSTKFQAKATINKTQCQQYKGLAGSIILFPLSSLVQKWFSPWM